MDADSIITWNIQNFVTVVLMAAVITVVVLFTAKAVRGKFGEKSA